MEYSKVLERRLRGSDMDFDFATRSSHFNTIRELYTKARKIWTKKKYSCIIQR